MACRKDKAPGLDGCNMEFLQEFWHVVKRDIVNLFNDFHITVTFVYVPKHNFYCSHSESK